MASLIYYSWGELNKQDAIDALRKRGLSVYEIEAKFSGYDFDQENITLIEGSIKEKKADYIFSFNYFPDVSRVAMSLGIKYISWVYDAPHYTLESKTLANDCNYIFLFDSSLETHYRQRGIKNVYYCPLPAKIVDNTKDAAIKDDICFVGNMYDGAGDQYGQIEYLPPSIKGKLDAYINTAKALYGVDLIGELVDEGLFSQVSTYVQANLGEHYNDCQLEIFRNMLRRRMTMLDRFDTLKSLGDALSGGYLGHGSLALYSQSAYKMLPVVNKGYAAHHKLPSIFNESRINLNISLRSILAGIPLRVMHILGAGGFVLTNYQMDLVRHFENGKQLVWYMDKEDMMEKAAYYLNHEDERRKVSLAGQSYARDYLTYESLFGEIFNRVG